MLWTFGDLPSGDKWGRQEVKNKIFNTTTILAGIAVLLISLEVISIWKPWQREPVAFYAPMIMPVEVIKGDHIVLPDGRIIIIQKDEVIHDFWWDSYGAYSNATIHQTLFGLIKDWWSKK